MPLFALAIFLSAFLLFQVQPLIARYILPWYGGSPAVWTTCLLFFQVGLLGGYAYAHGLVSFLREKPRWQVGIHFGLLALSFLLLPITPDDSLKPSGDGESPVAGILLLLASTVGFPYLLLSASGPLLQHWFSDVFPDRSPYRLYAVSNLGSILGLLTYPFLFEPLLAVTQQTKLWSFAYVFYALAAVACGVYLLKQRPRENLAESSPEA
ncbi:MAG: ferrichrome ABC transporter permease, partial [Verrucomicrobiota bacterium]